MDVAHGFVSQSENDSKTFVAPDEELHPADRSPGQSPDLNP